MNISNNSWYVVRTQPKREKSAANHLQKVLGVEAFAPYVEYTKATQRGKIKWKEAMFPCYIFAKFNLEEHLKAVNYSPSVLKVLNFGNEHPTINHEIIESLKSQLEDDDKLLLQPLVEEGEIYEIADGPLKGVEGQVVELLPSKERVTLLMDMLGNEQLVEIDIFSLVIPERPDFKSST